MKSILFAIILSTGCFGNDSNSDPSVSASSEITVKAAAIAPAKHWVPATAGQPYTACRYDSAGYTCPDKVPATLSPASWTVDAGAVILFPVVLHDGESIGAIRGKVDCSPGSELKLVLKAEDPDAAGEATFGTVTATCTGNTENLDLELSSYLLAANPDGYRFYSAMFYVSAGSAHVRGLEISPL